MLTILKSRQSRFAALLASLFGSLVATAKADDVADFYRGRTVTIVVGHETGTGFDVYSRVLARHLGRHILIARVAASSPTVVERARRAIRND